MASIREVPIRRDEALPYRRPRLPVLRAVPLPPPLAITCNFDSALRRRRSADGFGPLSSVELGLLLGFTAGLQATNLTDSNRQRRFAGSFGALHPAHILIGTTTNVWSVYLPDSHALGLLQVDSGAARLLRDEAEACHPGSGALLIALLADLDFAESYYLNPLQLLLRDGGVLLGHAALVAAAVDISFRILGTVGGNSVTALVPGLGFRSVGTGLAWLGSASIETTAAGHSPVDQIDALLGAG